VKALVRWMIVPAGKRDMPGDLRVRLSEHDRALRRCVCSTGSSPTF
jgi:hypothetical protein